MLSHGFISQIACYSGTALRILTMNCNLTCENVANVAISEITPIGC